MNKPDKSGDVVDEAVDDVVQDVEKTTEKAQDVAARETESTPVRRERARTLEIGMVVALSVFLVLAVLARTTAYFPLDLQISQALQAIPSTALAVLMTWVSWPGFFPQALVLALLIFGLVYYLGYRWEAVALATAGTAAQLSNTLIKFTIQRPRPTADLVNVVSELGSYSFPSGHVMFYVGFYGFLWFLIFTLLRPSWLRTLLLVLVGGLVVLVGPSRVYLGEHWPSDVFGAYIMGGIVLVLAIQFYRWGKPRYFQDQPAAQPEDEIDRP